MRSSCKASCCCAPLNDWRRCHAVRQALGVFSALGDRAGRAGPGLARRCGLGYRLLHAQSLWPRIGPKPWSDAPRHRSRNPCGPRLPTSTAAALVDSSAYADLQERLCG